MNDCEEFMNVIEPFLPLWPLVSKRSFVYKKGRKWFNLFTEITLCEKKRRYPNIKSLKKTNFRIFTENIDISALEQTIKDLKNQYVMYGQKKIVIPLAQNRDDIELRFNDYHYGNHPSYPYNARILTLETNNPTTPNEPQINHREQNKLDFILKAGEIPYEGIKDVCEQIFDERKIQNIYHKMEVKVIAPIPNWIIVDHEIVDSEFHGEINIPKKTLSKFIQIRYISNLGKERKSIKHFKERTGIHKFTIPLKKSPNIWLMVLFNGNTAYERNFYLTRPTLLTSPLLKVINHLNSYGLIENTIYSESPDSGQDRIQNFELAVTWIFSACGFQTTWVGHRKSTTDNFDIICFTPNSYDVLVIECTLREINKDNKLSKLERRTKEIERTLKGFRIIPVIVTALDSNTVSNVDTQTAQKYKIHVINRDELKTMLDMTNSGSTTTEVLNQMFSPFPFW